MNRNKIADAVIKMSVEIQKIANIFDEIFEASEIFTEAILNSKWDIFAEITTTEDDMYECVDCCYYNKEDNILAKATIMDRIKKDIDIERIERISVWMSGSDLIKDTIRMKVCEIYTECKQDIIDAVNEPEE